MLIYSVHVFVGWELCNNVVAWQGQAATRWCFFKVNCLFTIFFFCIFKVPAVHPQERMQFKAMTLKAIVYQTIYVFLYGRKMQME